MPLARQNLGRQVGHGTAEGPGFWLDFGWILELDFVDVWGTSEFFVHGDFSAFLGSFWSYCCPLVNIQKAMENGHV